MINFQKLSDSNIKCSLCIKHVFPVLDEEFAGALSASRPEWRGAGGSPLGAPALEIAAPQLLCDEPGLCPSPAESGTRPARLLSFHFLFSLILHNILIFSRWVESQLSLLDSQRQTPSCPEDRVPPYFPVHIPDETGKAAGQSPRKAFRASIIRPTLSHWASSPEAFRSLKILTSFSYQNNYKGTRFCPLTNNRSLNVFLIYGICFLKFSWEFRKSLMCLFKSHFLSLTSPK